MCGFAGFLGSECVEEEDKKRAVLMGDSLRHRGPDDSGVWIEPGFGIGVSHTRLSIQDLSSAGSQPMNSQSGRFVIAFNGEIYNFKELAGELRESQYVLEGGSDTEVLLGCIECFGLEKTLSLIIGMFAFALFDKRERQLILVRDRVGEKPLYYGWQSGVFLFGSEIRALDTHPACEAILNQRSIANLLAYSYIPDPDSIYCGVSKLLPGHSVVLSFDGSPGDESVSRWWSFPSPDIAQRARKTHGGLGESVESLNRVLNDVISDQSIADVPTGVFLSGGIDSSLTAAIMQRQSDSPVKTFTIGYDEPDYNEADHAKRIAEHLGTDHHELIVTPEHILDLVATISKYYDEPFADSSQLPTVLLSKLASEHVTVALSGDGGDEIFGGYNRYLWAEKLNGPFVSKVPLCLKRGVAGGILLIPELFIAQWFDWAKRWLRLGSSVQVPAEKLRKLAKALKSDSREALYRSLTTTCPAGELLIEVTPSNLIERHGETANVGTGSTEKMMRLDSVSYLPGDILVKVDRASMAFGLEVRAPFLDLRTIDFANSLPMEMKVTKSSGKIILKSLLQQYIPQELFSRPKSGFAIPVGRWLCGPLRDWGDSLLSREILNEQGIFNATAVRRMWEDHITGRENNVSCLWGILMFQSWMRTRNTVW